MPLNFFTILTIISIFLATILADKSEYLQKAIMPIILASFAPDLIR